MILTPASTSAVGTAATPSILVSNCDLSTLVNGVYDLRLIAVGGVQETTVDAQFILESGLKIGQFSFSQQDLVIPVNGIPYGWSWRLVTPVALAALLANEPGVDRLWTARGDCVYPSNASTPTTRYTYHTYDIEGNLMQVNSS